MTFELQSWEGAWKWDFQKYQRFKFRNCATSLFVQNYISQRVIMLHAVETAVYKLSIQKRLMILYGCVVAVVDWRTHKWQRWIHSRCKSLLTFSLCNPWCFLTVSPCFNEIYSSFVFWDSVRNLGGFDSVISIDLFAASVVVSTSTHGQSKTPYQDSRKNVWADLGATLGRNSGSSHSVCLLLIQYKVWYLIGVSVIAIHLN